MVGRPVGDAALREELLRRLDLDRQAGRAGKALFDKAAGGILRPADLLPEEQEILARLEDVDRDNTRWLGELVNRRGWPGRSLVGEDGALAAWLLAQHADQDPTLQRRCLDLMRAAPETEVSPSHIAYLTDRVLLAEGESQVYGSQMTMVGGEYRPEHLRDPDSVDQRRAAVGLDPMSKHLELMRQPPPEDA
ncbi:DUF6624 domain-containing protein [Pseudonocardia acidicola]|uniref:Terminase small subunit n=1 Tax=Pseudonocardia acidicola TaxID=2724939 RepID=A0ABX1S8Y3_9PSEU|nr:DUF6624 domain-containing protein [Pseudonocardia acidicola]NMH96613.1 terminase small subunit [Pseudonocardia acidicola]